MTRAGAVLASVFRLLPRSWRFRVMVLFAYAIVPLVRRTYAFQVQRKITAERPAEIALWFVVNALTVNGVLFDPLIAFEGLDHLVRLDREHRGVLLIQPHSAMTHLSFRKQFDAGLKTVGVNNTPIFYAGTRVVADIVGPGPMLLVRLRSRLRKGQLVCGAIDRGEHEPEKTVTVPTDSGPVIVAPALLDITLKCGGQVAFTRCWLERLRVRAEVVLPASSDSAGLTREYAEYVAKHRLRRSD